MASSHPRVDDGSSRRGSERTARAYDVSARSVARTAIMSSDDYSLDGLLMSESVSSSADRTFFNKISSLSKWGLSVPRVAVIGDTSSGKSSLLSGLCGLQLPSASRLTTKCPVEVHMERSEKGPDGATVSIGWKEGCYGFGSDSPPSSPRERKRVLEQVAHAYPAFDTIVVSDPRSAELTEAIEEAQSAVLSYRRAQVAPDVVSVRVTGSWIEEDLTLVDLPGLVQFEEKKEENGQQSLVQEVQAVVYNYLTDPNCILLAVLAANVDIHNSRALALAKRADPSTLRTVPVWTKPDLVDSGCEGDVVRWLGDEDGDEDDAGSLTALPPVPFAHGFYVVRNRGQSQLDGGVSLAENVAAEREFFDSTPPWSAIVRRRDRLGVPRLRRKLAELQYRSTKAEIPRIVKELQGHRQQCLQVLTDLGPDYSTELERRRYYTGVVQDLLHAVSVSLSGKGAPLGSQHRRRRHKRRGQTPSSNSSSSNNPPDRKPLTAAQLHQACAQFSLAIKSGSLATVQEVVEGAQVLVSPPLPPPPAGKSKNRSQTPAVVPPDIRGEVVHMDLEEGYCCVDFVDPKDHTTGVLFDGIGFDHSPPGTDDVPLEEDEVWGDGQCVYIARGGDGVFDSLTKIPLSRVRTDPSWLLDRIARHRTDDLACFLNADVFQGIVSEFVEEDWAPPCRELVETTRRLLDEAVESCLEEVLPATSCRHLRLRDHVARTCREVSNEAAEAAREQVEQHLESEQSHPYTQDEELLGKVAEARNRTLRRDLETCLRLDCDDVVLDAGTIASVLDGVFAKHAADPQLHMARELEVVLASYGQVATRRVLDRATTACWRAVRTLPGTLSDALGCLTDGVLRECLSRTADDERARAEAMDRLDEMQRALDLVSDIML